VRTIAEIVGAVQEQRPASDYEVRVALLAMHKTVLLLSAHHEAEEFSQHMMRSAPDKYLLQLATALVRLS